MIALSPKHRWVNKYKYYQAMHNTSKHINQYRYYTTHGHINQKYLTVVFHSLFN